ncbi:DUF4351 domain-containing protein [Anabaena cylindrica FACHB-243]|uniref:DUF4351 domain-containing protein n=1 Tax=Anabaena cylindrica (strain ATCC 27899 / PCC 7122) TaxID=272123 RepID=K9ZMN8_ANACC|nr:MULTISPECIES: DUF4351 domain-containing protein [Anabaena]AFZ59797.1 hypothetical protein Anacy_4439 [Anabaena cylindrica PCC 7122]MBD2417199.1 DUF4351 domain-containing protein [Anabaena cylindrica FACHB-243]MBY5282283.1 DUF4351 domain-containing protein [Anabaena sp. CCAP 1446/1C]MBY5309791.1 DUF4351 domain-containing protein [Anabaena sp. CCAP 1446/1C]MCM2404985.1 DUF4351 domain-containing protein [Anabaena sp. CCAP 1446/1C]
MTRFIHDQFAKDYLEELLKNYGEMQAPARVAGEVREIDVYFSPSPQKNPNLQLLGLLGKFASTPAIFEPYRNPASADEICDCLLKLLEVKGALKREAKRNKTNLQESKNPKLWILTPTASAEILSSFNATLETDSLPGIYYLGKALRTAIVVIHQLPRTEATLWIRMLGRGTVQKQAIEELAALTANHPFRRVTLELLYNLQKNLAVSQEPEDKEIIMRLAPLYQQDRELAVQEGKIEGKIEGETSLIIRQLNRRLGEIQSTLIERIQKLPLEKLETLGVELLDFAKVDDLESWLNQNQQ